MKKVLNKWHGDMRDITIGIVYDIVGRTFKDDEHHDRNANNGRWTILPEVVTPSRFTANSSVKYDDIPNQTDESAAAWKKAHPEESLSERIGKLDTLKDPTKAARFNAGKPPLSYMLEADVAMEGMCQVFEFGAKKYARNNWKKGLDVNEIMDSMLRHLISYKNGEVLDADSGLPHVDHVTCNAVFLATFGKRDAQSTMSDTKEDPYL